MSQIQPADPDARRIALWVVGIASLLGLCAILAFEYYQHDIQAWLELNIDNLVRNSFIVFLAALVFVSPVIAAGIYLLWLGNRIVKAKRFPPPQEVDPNNRTVAAVVQQRKFCMALFISITPVRSFMSGNAGPLVCVVTEIRRLQYRRIRSECKQSNAAHAQELLPLASRRSKPFMCRERIA